MTSKEIRKYLLGCALIYCVLLFVPALLFKFTNAPQTYLIFSVLSDWLVLQISVGWGEVFRSYGHYLVANMELAVVLLLIFSATRLTGALLGLLILSIVLLAHLLTPLGVNIVIDSSQNKDGGLLFALACGGFVACSLIIWLLLTQKSTLRAAHTQAIQKSLAAEEKMGSESEAIVDLVTLNRDIPCNTEVIFELDETFNKILFGVSYRVQDNIVGDHILVVERAQGLIDSLPGQRKYFPRRPLIIPKLIRAVNSESSTKKDLVEVISQDPVLAGELLKIANSPYYRISDAPVESIGRAILVLGMNGLKALASTLVMQPVVQIETGYFAQFPANIWIHAAKAAEAAQAYARKTRSCDSFTAHLLSLISSIGHIVVFQMVMDVYKEFSGMHPAIETLKLLCASHADKVSAAVAAEWGLSEDFVETLNDYQHRKSVNEMNSLSRSLYYGRLCATLHMLFEADLYTEERVRFVVAHQGLHRQVFDAMWQALGRDENKQVSSEALQLAKS